MELLEMRQHLSLVLAAQRLAFSMLSGCCSMALTLL